MLMLQFFLIFHQIKKKNIQKKHFLLANYIPDERVIYLDGDTFIFYDLIEMYNLEMDSNYILGFADNGFKYIDKYGYKIYKYITAGVLLIDLKNISNKNILKQNDQTVINEVLKKNIGFLPPKFGIRNFRNEKAALKYNNKLTNYYHKDIYNKREFLNAFENPTIVHYVYRKPWINERKYKNNFFHQKWWNLTKKLGLYSNATKLVK